MSLGIALLKERQPSLLRMSTLSEVESAAVGLENTTVGLVRIDSLDIVKEDSVEDALVVVGLDQIKLRSGQHCVAQAIAKRHTKSSTISETHSPSR